MSNVHLYIFSMNNKFLILILSWILKKLWKVFQYQLLVMLSLPSHMRKKKNNLCHVFFKNWFLNRLQSCLTFSFVRKDLRNMAETAAYIWVWRGHPTSQRNSCYLLSRTGWPTHRRPSFNVDICGGHLPCSCTVALAFKAIICHFL